MSDTIAQVFIDFRQYIFLILPVVIIIQSIGIPDGSALLVVASGAFAFLGEFNFYILFSVVLVSSVVGDIAGYWLWRLLGRSMMARFPALDRYVEPNLKKANKYYKRFGKVSIFITRFPPLSVLGTFINATAGISEFRLAEFIPLAIAGELLCTAIYLGLGYWFGGAWETMYNLIAEFGELVLLIFILIIMVYIYFVTVSKKRKDS